MTLGGIMTISFEREVSEDVFSDPNWPIFTYSGKRSISVISLIEYICKTTEFPKSIEFLDEFCAMKTLKYIYNNSNLSNYDSYLFISHSAWIEYNRVSNYKKLWKSLPKEWNISSFVLGSELGFQSKKGVRYAGIARIYKETFLRAIKILRANHTSLIILTENKKFDCEEQINILFKSAFTSEKISSIDWSNLSLALCKEGNILLRLSGSQDERESSLELIMTKEKLGDLGILGAL
jgi:hypothetical protein